MLTKPIAKINLGLNVVEKRPDGYHNLETVFYPVAIEDALEGPGKEAKAEAEEAEETEETETEDAAETMDMEELEPSEELSL